MKATMIAHWPGKDVFICNEHYEKMRGIAEALGVLVSATPLAFTDVECTNCVNEEKKKQEG